MHESKVPHHADRQEPGSRPPRKPYAKPSLIAYGTLARLTQSGNGSKMEGVVNFKMNTCL